MIEAHTDGDCAQLALLFETIFLRTSLTRLIMGFGGPEKATSPFASMYPTTIGTIGLHIDSSVGAGELDVSQRWDRGSNNNNVITHTP